LQHFFSSPLSPIPDNTTRSTVDSAPPGLEQQILNPPQTADDLVQKYNQALTGEQDSGTSVPSIVAGVPLQFPKINPAPSAVQNLRQTLEMLQINSNGSSLSAEQMHSQNSALQLQQSNLNDYQQIKSSIQKGSSQTSSQMVSSDLLF
jgi:hypothetical protein